ncbi:MAG: TIGR00153 family protein [Myxococcota bacterium]
MFPFKLFATNPFTPLRAHMQKTVECVEATRSLFDALWAGDQERVKEAAKVISQLEHEADIIKHEIRSNLGTSVFLPVDRRDLLSLLSGMDAIADHAEDLGVLLTLRWMELPAPLKPFFEELRARVLTVVHRASDVIESFDSLVEAGFSGPDAEGMLTLVDEVCRLEHEADKAQDQFGKQLFAHEDDFKPAALFMWIKIANKVGDIANAAERMVNQTRLMVAR